MGPFLIPDMLKSLIGICSLSIITIFTLGLSFNFLVFSPFAYYHYTKYCCIFKRFWFNCILSVASVLIPSNLYISSNTAPIYSDGINIYMSNHQLLIDWLYSWYLKYIFYPSTDISFVLKSSLYNVPIVGMVMFCVKFYV